MLRAEGGGLRKIQRGPLPSGLEGGPTPEEKEARSRARTYGVCGVGRTAASSVADPVVEPVEPLPYGFE